ncbi:hypothetical protein EXIGLDRAFT_559291, partial [Exidia glandulosa HHB12029]
NMRRGEKNFHDRVFEEEIYDLINQTKAHYEATMYKDALKTGFFEFQMARDWYREVAQQAGGMHADLAMLWIRSQVLLALPIMPHFAEHIWTTLLNEPKSVQHALWPESRTADPVILECGQYLRTSLRTLREGEGSAFKALEKAKQKSGKGAAVAPKFDPTKPKAIRMYVASSFPAWQDTTVDIVRQNYNESTGVVDDAKVREQLAKAGLMKDKKIMPFVQAFKKRIATIGAKSAFQRKLPFSEVDVLTELVPYIKKNMNLVEVDVISVE